jgi:hypothetical protein
MHDMRRQGKQARDDEWKRANPTATAPDPASYELEPCGGVPQGSCAQAEANTVHDVNNAGPWSSLRPLTCALNREVQGDMHMR